MASASLTALFSCRVKFVSVVLWMGSFHHVAAYAPLLQMTCQGFLDLKGITSNPLENEYDAGLIESTLPPRIGPYVNEEDRCDITLIIPATYGMMFSFVWLDFNSEDLATCRTASLSFYDGTVNQYVTGLQKPVCGHEAQMPKGYYFVNNNLLLIRVEAENEVQGRGFQIHFTVFRTEMPCRSSEPEEFLCETQGPRRCIAEHLVCDDWNDCGDWVDEEYWCKYISKAGIAFLVVGIFILIGVILLVVCWCRRRKGYYRLTCSAEGDGQAVREKDLAEIRGSSMENLRGLREPYHISNETLEKDSNVSFRYPNNSRHSGGGGRRSRSQTPTKDLDYDEDETPPAYSEKSPMYNNSRDNSYEDGEPRRSRRRSRTRDSTTAEMPEEGGGVIRGRRARSRSWEGRPPSRVEEPELAREERYPRDRDERYTPTDRERYPSRREHSRDSPRNDRRSYDRDDDSYDRYPDDRRRPRYDDRYPPRDYRDSDSRDSDHYDDRDRDRHSRRDRERDRDQDRHDRDRDWNRNRDRERDQDRERDRDSERDRDRTWDTDRNRDRPSRRERPRSRGDPDDRHRSRDESPQDQLHPLREKRRSAHISDSDLDSSRDDRKVPSRDRSREEERDASSREDPDDRTPRNRGSRSAARDDRTPDRRNDHKEEPYTPPQRRNDRHSASAQSPPTRSEPQESRPHSRHNTPSSNLQSPPSTKVDSPEAEQSSPRRKRRRERESRDTPVSPADDNPETPDGEEIPRRRRRRSQERPRSSRYREEDEGEEPRGRRSRSSVLPVGGTAYKEESV